jgi:hypothetical protein
MKQRDSRCFLSGDLMHGVLRSDVYGTVHYHKHFILVKRRDLCSSRPSRYLSEIPTTYLR